MLHASNFGNRKRDETSKVYLHRMEIYLHFMSIVATIRQPYIAVYESRHHL